MLSKIKKNSIAFIMILTLQTTIFGMHENECKQLSLIYKKPYLPYNINSLNFWSSLKEIFSRKDHSASTTLAHIKSDLIKFVEYLQTNDLENNPELQETINRKYKQLWNDFLMLHNHNWIDQFMYPNHPHIDNPENNKYRRELLRSLHPDKNQSIINKSQQNELYKHLTDTARPEKPMDCIINPFVDAVAHLGSQASFNIFQTTCFLPSILFPQFFSNQETRFFKKYINQANKEISQCNRSVKILERNIETRHEELKKTFNIVSSKTKKTQN